MSARGIVPAGTIGAPGPLGHAWRRLRRRARAVLPGFARRTAPELVITADWRIPGESADATVGRLRLEERPLRPSPGRGHRAEGEARDLDALLTALGDVPPEELETALRVVRRVRALAGAA